MPAQDIVLVLRVDDKGTRVVQQFAAKGTEAFQRVGGAAAKSGKNIEAISKKMTKVGKGLTKGLTLPLVGLSAAAIKASFDFNKAMANVATLIPGNIKLVKEMKAGVQDLAVAYGTSSKDIADGLYQVISAGFDVADAMKVTEISVKAAAAGMATTTDAINLLSAVTKGYGDTSIAAVEKVANLAFQTVKLGQTTFPELAQSMGRVIPISAKLKVSQEELFAVFATLTGVTGNAAEVSTQMAGVLRGMMKPTERMTELINKMGYATSAEMVASEGLVGAMRKLTSMTDGTAESVAKLLPRAEALVAWFAITGEQADVFDKKLEQMADSSSALDDAFKEMTEGVNKTGFSFQQLKQLTIVLLQKIGDELAPALGKIIATAKPLVEKIIGLVGWFSKLPGPIRMTSIALMGVAAAAGPVLVVSAKLITAWKTLAALKTAKAIVGMKSAVSGLIPALGKMGTSIATVGAGTTALAVTITGALAYGLGSLINKIPAVSRFFEGLSAKVLGLDTNLKNLSADMENLGSKHAALAKIQTLALAQATEIAGKEVTRITEAYKILREEYKKVGTTGVATLDTLIAKQVKQADELRTKVSPELQKVTDLFMKQYKEGGVAAAEMLARLQSLVAEYKKAKKDVPESVQAAVDSLKRQVVAQKAAEEAAKAAAKAYQDQLKSYREAVPTMKNVNAQFKILQQVINEYVGRGGDAKELTKAFGEEITALYEDAKVAEKVFGDEMDPALKAMGEVVAATDEKVKGLKGSLISLSETGISGFFAPAMMQAIEAQKRMAETAAELGVTLKSQVQANLKKTVEDYNKLKAAGELTAESEMKVISTIIDLYKKLGTAVPEEWEKALEAAEKSADATELSWKAVNEQIQADQIRTVAEILKSNGNLVEGLKGIWNGMVSVWVDKMAEMITNGENVWTSLKTGFEGLSKSISSSFAGVGGLLGQLGGKMGGIFGNLAGGAGNLITKFAGLAGPIGAAISIGSKLPVIGGFIQGITNKVSGLLSKIPLIGGLFKKTVKKTEEEIRAEKVSGWVDGITKKFAEWGEVSESTAQAIAEDVVDKGMKGYIAVSSHFAQIIEDVGVKQENINQLWKRATDILGQYAAGELDAKVAAEQAGESFKKLVEGAQRFGTEGSAAMVEFIRQTKASGLEVQEVTDYINDQLGVVESASMSAAQGLEAMAEGVGKNKNALAVLERQTMVTFNAMLENGASYATAMNSLGPVLDAILKKHEELGTTGGAGIQELLRIREVTQEHEGLFRAIEGNKAVLDALANTGSLTQQSFQDAANQTKNYYNSLMKAGLDSNQALAQMAPTLERLAFLQKEHGLKVDKTTQSLIDMAKEQGLIEDEQMSMQETMMAGFGMLLDALGVDIPEAMQKSVDKMRELEEGMAGSGVVSALEKVKTAAVDTFGTMNTKVSSAFKLLGQGIDSAITGIRDLEKKVQKTHFKIPVSVSRTEDRGGTEVISAQTGGTFRVTRQEQPFVAHRGEEVTVTPAGKTRSIDTLLSSLIEAVRSSSVNVVIEPVVIPRETDHVVKFVVKKLERGDIRVPTTAVRGA